MTAEDRALLLAAVNRLVTDEEAARLYEALNDVIPVARRLGARLTGDLADLNPLIELACQRPEHYDNVMLLVETKREQAGKGPLDPKRNAIEKFDKNEYMAEFMQRKRERERKAADIENMLRPERDRLIGRSRLDFMQMQAGKWKQQLDERIETARKATGTRLKKEQLEVIRRAFWDEVDRYLDELEEYARAEMLKPVHQRRARPT